MSLAAKGDSDPFTASSYQLYGMHPNILWAQIVADRKGKLGWEYDLWYFDDCRLKPDIVIPDFDPLCRRKQSPSAERFCNERLHKAA